MPTQCDKLQVHTIHPAEIDGDAVWDGAFGTCESETAAGFILQYARMTGGWTPFTARGLKRHAEESNAKVPYSLVSGLTDLTQRGFLELDEGYFRVNSAFIERLCR
ncbi:MAG: hypothetical protein HYT40_04170 [Candidatus Sungbacteria bacterium]|uniref:Uncharacterized protein n=1 Tax=Candidatus Sungiibacteriota bacterium TaxID=2750080 RepID=A0A931SEB9_9BACT|nr:hypothetical protein [Candidatus Sungbacteria bacterium]